MKFGDFYEELKQNDALNEKFKEACKEGEDKVVEFLKENDCEATLHEIKEYLAELKAKKTEDILNEDLLKQVFGGGSEGFCGYDCTYSLSCSSC